MSLEQHFTRFLSSADSRLHEGAQAFLDFFRSEEARRATIVADAKSIGLKVLDESGNEL